MMATKLHSCYSAGDPSTISRHMMLLLVFRWCHTNGRYITHVVHCTVFQGRTWPISKRQEVILHCHCVPFHETLKLVFSHWYAIGGLLCFMFVRATDGSRLAVYCGIVILSRCVKLCCCLRLLCCFICPPWTAKFSPPPPKVVETCATTLKYISRLLMR